MKFLCHKNGPIHHVHVWIIKSKPGSILTNNFVVIGL